MNELLSDNLIECVYKCHRLVCVCVCKIPYTTSVRWEIEQRLLLIAIIWNRFLTTVKSSIQLDIKILSGFKTMFGI